MVSICNDKQVSEGNPSRLQVLGEAENHLIWPYSGGGTPFVTSPFRFPEWGRAFMCTFWPRALGVHGLVRWPRGLRLWRTATRGSCALIAGCVAAGHDLPWEQSRRFPLPIDRWYHSPRRCLLAAASYAPPLTFRSSGPLPPAPIAVVSVHLHSPARSCPSSHGVARGGGYTRQLTGGPTPPPVTPVPPTRAPRYRGGTPLGDRPRVGVVRPIPHVHRDLSRVRPTRAARRAAARHARRPAGKFAAARGALAPRPWGRRKVLFSWVWRARGAVDPTRRSRVGRLDDPRCEAEPVALVHGRGRCANGARSGRRWRPRVVRGKVSQAPALREMPDQKSSASRSWEFTKSHSAGNWGWDWGRLLIGLMTSWSPRAGTR